MTKGYYIKLKGPSAGALARALLYTLRHAYNLHVETGSGHVDQDCALVIDALSGSLSVKKAAYIGEGFVPLSTFDELLEILDELPRPVVLSSGAVLRWQRDGALTLTDGERMTVFTRKDIEGLHALSVQRRKGLLGAIRYVKIETPNMYRFLEGGVWRAANANIEGKITSAGATYPCYMVFQGGKVRVQREQPSMGEGIETIAGLISALESLHDPVKGELHGYQYEVMPDGLIRIGCEYFPVERIEDMKAESDRLFHKHMQIVLSQQSQKEESNGTPHDGKQDDAGAGTEW